MFEEATCILFAILFAPIWLGLLTEAHRRKIFRFPLRDTLWATAVLAMGLAWWADRSELYEHKAALWRAVHRFAEARPGDDYPESVYQEIPWLRERRINR
jgi:hypothetical protein